MINRHCQWFATSIARTTPTDAGGKVFFHIPLLAIINNLTKLISYVIYVTPLFSVNPTIWEGESVEDG